jgi:hypothetical protein
MKTFLTLSTTLACCLISNAGEVTSSEEKAEMQRSAEEYRKCAKENKDAKLEECDENASEIVKAAANKVIGNHQKIGAIEEQLAAAYDAGDKKLIQQLHQQKSDAELECELSEKEKKAAYVTSSVNDLIQNMPDSAEAKQLKVKTEADIKAYLDNAKKMMAAQKEQARLEKGMEMIDARIEIIKKREELKKMEEDAAQNK